MKIQYLLFLTFASCCQICQGQYIPEHHLTLGVARNSFDLHTDMHYSFNDAFTRSGIDVDQRPGISGFGISGGYSYRYHPQWELTFQAQYSGNSTIERFGDGRERLSSSIGFPVALEHPRSYRSMSLEGLIFYRVSSSYSGPDILLGTGLVYLLYQQEYLSGFIRNDDLGIYDGRIFTKDRNHSTGIPFHSQLQFPIHPDWKVGFAAYLNLFVDGETASGLMAFVKYRL